MVFFSFVRFVRSRGPDEFWRKRKIFKLSAHYIGRRRNCYSIAIRSVHRALAYATKGRKLKKLEMANVWATRVEAAAAQYDLTLDEFQRCLTRSDILLNKKMLADLAIWEPRTFESLAMICRDKLSTPNFLNPKRPPILEQLYGIKKGDN